MQRIKKGDTVEVIAGKDLGARGEVVSVLPKEDRVIVAGVNIVKKHEKERQTGDQRIPAQIVEVENGVHMSNVMVVCPTCDKRTRVGFRLHDDGFKTRVCKQCDAEIDKR